MTDSVPEGFTVVDQKVDPSPEGHADLYFLAPPERMDEVLRSWGWPDGAPGWAAMMGPQVIGGLAFVGLRYAGPAPELPAGATAVPAEIFARLIGVFA